MCVGLRCVGRAAPQMNGVCSPGSISGGGQTQQAAQAQFQSQQSSSTASSSSAAAAAAAAALTTSSSGGTTTVTAGGVTAPATPVADRTGSISSAAGGLALVGGRARTALLQEQPRRSRSQGTRRLHKCLSTASYTEDALLPNNNGQRQQLLTARQYCSFGSTQSPMF